MKIDIFIRTSKTYQKFRALHKIGVKWMMDKGGKNLNQALQGLVWHTIFF